LGFHGALWLLAWRSFGSRVGNANVQIPVEVSFEAAAPPDEPPPIPPAPDESQAHAVAKPPEHQRLRAPAQHAEPATAQVGGQSGTPAPAPTLPVDLTGEMFLAVSSNPSSGGPVGQGEGGAGAGGTGGGGSSASAVGEDGASDRAGGVSLASQNWSCPWPREADAEQIDEVTVTIRVVVSADGAAESVTVLSDPGHGFGAAALACALRTHFTPARNHIGRPVRATSPPILVKFTR
jgi:protein TonB